MRISDWSSDVCSSDLDLRINYSLPIGFGRLNLDLSGNWTEQSKFKASPTSINRECVGQYSSNCGFFAGEITPKYSFNMRATAQIDDFGDISLLDRKSTRLNSSH